MKYFIPPFFAMLAFVIFIGELKDIVLFMVFGYPVTLFIHLIGCCYIKILKYLRFYSLPILLISGFIFGAVASSMVFSNGNYGLIIMLGFSGMLNCWVYYYFDEKTVKVSNNLAS